jgi:hypothetical protein
MNDNDYGPALSALFGAEDGAVSCAWCGADTPLDGAGLFTRAGRTRLACEPCSDVLSGRYETRMLNRLGLGESGRMTTAS